MSSLLFFFFFFNDTATTEIYTLSLHDALPISRSAISIKASGRFSIHRNLAALDVALQPRVRHRSQLDQVYGTPKELFQRLLEVEVLPLRRSTARLAELNGHVQIAGCRIEVVTERRAEERETLDGKATTQGIELTTTLVYQRQSECAIGWPWRFRGLCTRRCTARFPLA